MSATPIDFRDDLIEFPRLIEAYEKSQNETREKYKTYAGLNSNESTLAVKALQRNKICALVFSILFATATVAVAITWAILPLSVLVGASCLTAALLATTVAGVCLHFSIKKEKAYADVLKSTLKDLTDAEEEQNTAYLMLVDRFSLALAANNYKWSESKFEVFEKFGKYCTGLKIEGSLQFGVELGCLIPYVDTTILSQDKKKIINQLISGQAKNLKTSKSILEIFVSPINKINNVLSDIEKKRSKGTPHSIELEQSTEKELWDQMAIISPWLKTEIDDVRTVWNFVEITRLFKACPNLENVRATLIEIPNLFQKAFQEAAKERPGFVFSCETTPEDPIFEFDINPFYVTPVKV